MDYCKFYTMLKIHAYLLQFLCKNTLDINNDELKEVMHFRQKSWVQVLYSNANYKFEDHTFSYNIEYYKSIEKMNN